MFNYIETALAESKAILKLHYPRICYRTKVADNGIDLTLIVRNVEDYDYACQVGSDLTQLLASKHTNERHQPVYYYDVIIKPNKVDKDDWRMSTTERAFGAIVRIIEKNGNYRVETIDENGIERQVALFGTEVVDLTNDVRLDDLMGDQAHNGDDQESDDDYDYDLHDVGYNKTIVDPTGDLAEVAKQVLRIVLSDDENGESFFEVEDERIYITREYGVKLAKFMSENRYLRQPEKEKVTNFLNGNGQETNNAYADLPF
jgi:hypothetical protein